MNGLNLQQIKVERTEEPRQAWDKPIFRGCAVEEQPLNGRDKEWLVQAKKMRLRWPEGQNWKQTIAQRCAITLL